MSYCRFRNTVIDLDDCADELEALLSGTDGDGDAPVKLSAEELRAAKRLVSKCFDIVHMVADTTGQTDLSEIEEDQIDEALDTAQAEAEDQ